MRALVTGATGYVGSRLVTALLAAGHDVVATARHPERMTAFEWYDAVDAVPLDVLDPDSCARAFSPAVSGGIDVAYYLVHAIGEGDFAARDRDGARTFGAAARAGNTGRIVYLGGFVPDGETLSEHLDSRAETGEELERSGVPVVALQAAVIIGAGSTSFEIIRYLADRLPVLPVPSWMNHLVAPIAVDDVLHYLVAAGSPSLPPGAYDIAGTQALPYRELLQAYLDAAGLRRRLVPVPAVTPPVAAAVIGRITPVPAALTADLIESLKNTMIGQDDRIRSLVPDPPGGLTSIDDAMRRALALPGVGTGPDALALQPQDAAWAGGDRNQVVSERVVAAPAATTWERVERLGGADGLTGWPVAWRLRGVGRRLLLGSGLPVRRSGADGLHVGDRLDFFTVDTVVPGRCVRLATAPLRTGRGRLLIEVTALGADRCTLRVTATWEPRGVSGRASWLAGRPLHTGSFASLARTIARDAEAATSRAD